MKEGAKLIGEIPEENPKGFFVKPTILCPHSLPIRSLTDPDWDRTPLLFLFPAHIHTVQYEYIHCL